MGFGWGDGSSKVCRGLFDLVRNTGLDKRISMYWEAVTGLTLQYSRWRCMHLSVGCDPPIQFKEETFPSKSQGNIKTRLTLFFALCTMILHYGNVTPKDLSLFIFGFYIPFPCSG